MDSGDSEDAGRIRLGVVLLLVAAVLLITAGLTVEREKRDRFFDRVMAWVDGTPLATGEQYWCVMDPEILLSRPGTCPICSMDLVPYDGEGAGGATGVLQLTDRQIQQAGVRLGEVRLRDLVREIDATGRLEVDPTKRRTLTLSYPGRSRIEKLFLHAAGDSIAKNGVVAEVHNETALELLEEYRTTLAEYASLRQKSPDQAPAALIKMNSLRARFEEFGLPVAQLGILASKPKHLFSAPVFPVISPVAGEILEAPAVREGRYVPEGTALVEVVDLNSLWLYVDLYEHELPLVEEGQRVEFTTLAAPEETFSSTIRRIEPIARPGARTVRARCKVGSAGGRLMPGMFARVVVHADPGRLLAVPESAVIQSGRRDVVLVAEGGGRFRPRLVQLGRRHLSVARDPEQDAGFGADYERYHEVLGGLSEGDRIAVSGVFLLNAEAQFQGILRKMIENAEEAANADELAAGAAEAFEEVLDAYFALSDALVADAADRLPELARTLGEKARAASGADEALDPLLERLSTSAAELPGKVSDAGVDLDAARTHFGSLSREVVLYLRDFAPTRVTEGELHLFRCPMADDFGYDLWVQREPGLQNPYMGPWMPECGMAAELF